MKRRVLIVVSAFAPTMVADMHRARHLTFELPANQWDVEILSPEPGAQLPAHIDDDSKEYFNEHTSVFFSEKRFGHVMRLIGSHSAAWQCMLGMIATGNQLLSNRNYDLIYISTTSVVLFGLGPLWKKKFGVPFVLDIHDPFYKFGTWPPLWSMRGIRRCLIQLLLTRIGLRAARRADGIVSVSPMYLKDLFRVNKHGHTMWESDSCAAVIPFAVLPQDFVTTMRSYVSECPDKIRIVYVGAGGAIMRRSFLLLCEALSLVRDHDVSFMRNIQIELYGTKLDWKEGQPAYLAEIAKEKGLSDFVLELPAHVSYRRSLELLLGSDGALVLGVDDAGYMPSKLFSYGYSGKPLLASLRRDGPAFSAFQQYPVLGHSLWFGAHDQMPTEEAAAIVRAFLQEAVDRKHFDRRRDLESQTASSMAQRHVQLFEACLEHG